MKFIFECPFCEQKLDCDDEHENQTMSCPSCNEEIAPVRDIEVDDESIEQKAGSQTSTKPLSSGMSKKITKKELFSTAKKKKAESKVFKRPILSTVFYISGVLLSIAFGVMLIVWLFMLAGGDKPLVRVDITLLSLIVCAVVHFGIAQVLYYIGKICFNSDQIVEQLTKDN